MSERKPMTKKIILPAVTGERFFGFVEIYIQVPCSLRPLMLQITIHNNLYNQPQKSLTGSMFASKILLTTDLL